MERDRKVVRKAAAARRVWWRVAMRCAVVLEVGYAEG